DDSERAFVKGFYRRPFRQGETESVRGGGRVTELTAKPLLARCVPDLIAFDQPLAGEIAVRRDVLSAIPFHTGYGVEIAMLVEVWNRVGLSAMVQVDLGTKRNAHQSLSALNGMANEVVAALAEVRDRLDRPDLGRIGAAADVRTDPVVRPPFGSLAPEIA
ncbi:MAG: glucosyl-3-phosphoglycerate synthase, partial [Solirubrobacterales bacterium]